MLCTCVWCAQVGVYGGRGKKRKLLIAYLCAMVAIFMTLLVCSALSDAARACIHDATACSVDCNAHNAALRPLTPLPTTPRSTTCGVQCDTSYTAHHTTPRFIHATPLHAALHVTIHHAAQCGSPYTYTLADVHVVVLYCNQMCVVALGGRCVGIRDFR